MSINLYIIYNFFPLILVKIEFCYVFRMHKHLIMNEAGTINKIIYRMNKKEVKIETIDVGVLDYTLFFICFFLTCTGTNETCKIFQHQLL